MSLLANPLVTPEQLFQRRSVGALPMEIQDAIFFATQSLTQAAGILLELPQSVTAQANVLLARYWLVENMMADEFSVRIPLPLLPKFQRLTVPRTSPPQSSTSQRSSPPTRAPRASSPPSTFTSYPNPHRSSELHNYKTCPNTSPRPNPTINPSAPAC